MWTTRDFTYVTDTARGFLAVAECDRALGEVVTSASVRAGQVSSLTDDSGAPGAAAAPTTAMKGRDDEAGGAAGPG
ncbi:hypothetical protein C1N81_18000 [Streptomyces sp. SGAir0957]